MAEMTIAEPAGPFRWDMPVDAPARSDLTARRIAISLMIAMSVAVLVIVSVRTSRPEGLVAAFWPAIGVAVVGWLRGPRTRAFDLAYSLFLVLAFAIANVLVENGLQQTLTFVPADILEAALAVVLIRRFSPGMELNTLKGSLRFMLVAPVLAPLPSALIVATSASFGHWGHFWPAAQTWWLGHALGLAAVAPFGLSLSAERLKRLMNSRRVLEALLLITLVALGSAVAFMQHERPFAYLLYPLLLVCAARLRTPGAAAAVLIVTASAIYGALWKLGPTEMLIGATMAVKVRLMQMFSIFVALPALPVAALLDERDALAAAARAGQSRAESTSAGKSRLLANVSHEIKSPVAGIIGIGDLWLTGKLGPVTKTQEEMAAMLVRTARQIEVLAYDLLDVAQAESGAVQVKLQAIDLEAVSEDVRRSVSVLPEAAGLRWSLEGGGEPTIAHADSVRVVQIVTNLVTNAVKYGRSGGVVVLKLSRPTLERVRLEVIDRGPGISAAKQSELFEPFNRLGMEKTAVEGHGIGLALAKRLAELQGGALGFTSRPGEGSTFWLELPASRSES